MATLESIAIRIEQALDRLNAAAAQIAEYVEVSMPEVPDWNRSTEELRAEQLEAVAGWAESIAGHFEARAAEAAAAVEPESPDYSTLTVAELEALIAERGIDTSALTGSGAHGAVIKADLLLWLQQYDAAQANGDGQ